MNTREHETMKMRGSSDVSYLGQAVDSMIYDFMREHGIPGLTLAIVQAPYIPRVVGYGMSDEKQRRLASPNTMWPAGDISQAFAAVAVMQLYEDGRLELSDTVGKWIQEVPESWKKIEVLQLLRHASGLPDYRFQQDFNPYRAWTFGELIDLVQALPLHFIPGTEAMQSATNFLLLTEIVERAGEQSYHDFVTKRQIQYLGLRHTGFAEDLGNFMHEDVSLTENVHQLFKKDRLYIDPTEPAASYDGEGSLMLRTQL